MLDKQWKIDYLTADRDGWRRLYIASDSEAMRLWLYTILTSPFVLYGLWSLLKWIATHVQVILT